MVREDRVVEGLLGKGRVAEMLGVSVRTVDRLVSMGDLKRVKVRGAARITMASVREFLKRITDAAGKACPGV